MTAVVRFWLTHKQELASLVAEHVLLVTIATPAAVAIGVPLGQLGRDLRVQPWRFNQRLLPGWRGASDD